MPVLSRTHVALLGHLLLQACAAHASTTQRPAPAAATAPVAEQPAAPVADPPSPVQAGALSRADREGEYLGVIDRAGLTAIVQQGLGRMLARLQLRPDMDGKRFRGFRVATLDPEWNASGVLSGDVITRLNGQPIERPEQALAAFESLRVASEVAVDIVREGKPLRLRYRVE